MKDYYSYTLNNKTIYQIPALIGTYDNYVYMIEENGNAWVFDPAEAKPVQKVIDEKELTLAGILITHHHPDHIGGIEDLVKKHNCNVYGHSEDKKRIPFISNQVHLGDKIKIGSMVAEIQFYPGHTLGLIAYYFEEENWIFSNDLIFSLGCGRVFEGTMEQMYTSLHNLSLLPDETILMISHEYTKKNLDFARSLFPNDPALKSAEDVIVKKLQNDEPTVPTSLGFEKAHNPFLRWSDPHIREALKMPDSENWQVFAEIRTRKDIT